MSDYIKREDALKIVRYETEFDDDYNRCTYGIEGLPSADVEEEEVEVVHCKDCKWGWLYGSEGFCHNLEVGIYSVMAEDDFCSYGERKEEEDG